MKALIFTLTSALCLSALLLSSPAARADEPLAVPFKHAYIPRGFDGNDQTQIVVEGSFPASCYRVDDPQVNIDQQNHIIRIQARGEKVDGYCFVMPSTFSQTVNLGQLPVGDYRVTSPDGRTVYGDLPVVAAKVLNEDDYIYAQVSQAWVEQQNGQSVITVSGTLPAGCMDVSQVLVSQQPDVIVAQPILKQDNSKCGAERAFQVSAPIAPNTHGRYLLHVRSSAGTAFDVLQTIP